MGTKIKYLIVRVLGLIGLCLIVVIPWHFFLKPLWEKPYEWQLVMGFIVFTYLVGLQAESTGDPDAIGLFYLLLLLTTTWSCTIVGLILESMI
ncbi:MAG: hypothetical protein JSW00_17450, partial [Thermoplasmata archaeon]